MLFEHRTYQLVPGKIPEFIKLYTEVGGPLQWPVLGKMAGAFYSEVGPMHQVTHIWQYESLADMEERRKELVKQPQRTVYQQGVMPMLQTVETKLIVPAPYWSPES